MPMPWLVQTLDGDSQKADSHNGGITSHPHSVQAFKIAAQSSILEYFESSDIDEVAERVLELEDPGLHHILIKHAVRMALDRRDREREMISVLLSSLYPRILTGDQLGQGFARLLASAEDLVLDNPDAAHLISLFLGRIIVDEVLPPSFLTSVLGSMKDDSLGIQIVQSTGNIYCRIRLAPVCYYFYFRAEEFSLERIFRPKSRSFLAKANNALVFSADENNCC